MQVLRVQAVCSLQASRERQTANMLASLTYIAKMPKKKKKSGKLAKMTEDERMMYLEQQRLAEEEMKKKKEDMLTQFLKVRSEDRRHIKRL